MYFTSKGKPQFSLIYSIAEFELKSPLKQQLQWRERTTVVERTA